MTELEGRELDAKIHTDIFEWRKVIDSEKFGDVWQRDDPIFPNGFQAVRGDPPNYSRDIAAAWLVEERIEELGLVGNYCKYLNYMADAKWEAGDHSGRSWQIIHASPEDRCRAALMAAEAKG